MQCSMIGHECLLRLLERLDSLHQTGLDLIGLSVIRRLNLFIKTEYCGSRLAVYHMHFNSYIAVV